MSAIATGAPTRPWEPFKLGRLELKNRLVMAPMTRDRATPPGTPTELNARYYAQRASFGLQLTEGTQPSADGQGYLLTPGVYTDEHVSGWKQVADAVHAAGGHLYLQLMHVGASVAPRQYAASPASARALGGQAGSEDVHREGNAGHPRAPRAHDGGDRADDRRLPPRRPYRHRRRSRRCRAARSQRVPDPAVPRREHEPAKRRVWRQRGSSHALRRRGGGRGGRGDRRRSHGHPPLARQQDARHRRGGYDGHLPGARPAARAPIAQDVDSGLADLASVASFALANPDLVTRLQTNAPLNAPDKTTFFGGGEHGYTDYPTLTA